MYYGIETLYTRKNRPFLVAVSACCEKILVIEIVRTTYIRDYRKYQYSGNRGKKAVLYLLAGHNGRT